MKNMSDLIEEIKTSGVLYWPKKIRETVFVSPGIYRRGEAENIQLHNLVGVMAQCIEYLEKRIAELESKNSLYP